MLKSDTSLFNVEDWDACDVPTLFINEDCIFCSSEETDFKQIWKSLSTNSTMDKMKDDLKDDEGCKKWLENINVHKDIQHIVEADNTKSYEDIFSELGSLDVQNTEANGENLEDLIKRVVEQKLSTMPDETKKKLFRTWDVTIRNDTPNMKKK
ncbi:uncharacterized protein [Periplaneta americana]|uniref:uncharacterized protein isoform X1 n=1 Tax=Periplaneta americana TaxID=6978 RepID=UPI0037E714B0